MRFMINLSNFFPISLKMNIFKLTVAVMYLGFSLSLWALVPVEGLILGEATLDIQDDPLAQIFPEKGEETLKDPKLSRYQDLYVEGSKLKASCEKYVPLKYGSPNQETVAKRSISASLQLLGLDLTVKSIGAYARHLNVSEEEFQKLSQNLVKNYCSQNVTVLSLKTIKSSLKYYYDNPETKIIPTFQEIKSAPASLKEASELMASRRKEFNEAVQGFRAFCSWGGDVDDYRLLPPYLNNPFIYSLIISRLTAPAKEGLTDKVLCKNLICRQVTDAEFKNQFPKGIGSTGLKTDLEKQYCFYFRNLDYAPKQTVPQVAAWIKAQELESPILSTNFFISLLTGVPDIFFGVSEYKELLALSKTNFEERWEKWAKNVLDNFGRKLFYEESLKVRVLPERNLASLPGKEFRVDLSVTLGELDRVFNDRDKVKSSFELKLPKNYLRSLRTKWNDMARNVATSDQEAFLAENADYMKNYLRPKEDLFRQKVWNEDFANIVSQEILRQVLGYDGKLFESYEAQMVSIPVTFNYGLFALNYLRYRADIKNNRLDKKL